MIRALYRDRTASSAAEFALVLPLVMILLFGIVDVGRWLWTYNDAQTATQMGARFAVVTTPIASALNANYVGACSPALTQGDNIPADCFSTITCTNGSSSASCDNIAFQNVVARMQQYLPDLSADNVEVQYSASGLGYAGNPNGPDISPLVTVKIGDSASNVAPLTFQPITAFLLTSMDMPSFATSLTAEDLKGSASN